MALAPVAGVALAARQPGSSAVTAAAAGSAAVDGRHTAPARGFGVLARSQAQGQCRQPGDGVACRSRANSWNDWRRTAHAIVQRRPRAQQLDRASRRLLVVNEIGGQYEESFADVQKHMLDCFTFKAVRSVLGQLQETNPPQYAFLYNFVVNNKPQDGKIFIQTLVKERQELGERVMVTRLHLFNLWIKRYNHAQLYKAISEQNLELLRERLVQTVRFSDVEEGERPPPEA